MDGTMRKPCASTWCQARVCAYINCNTKSTIHDSLRAPRTLTLHTSHSLCASRGATRHGTCALALARTYRSRTPPLSPDRQIQHGTSCLLTHTASHRSRATRAILPHHSVSAAHTETTQQQYARSTTRQRQYCNRYQLTRSHSRYYHQNFASLPLLPPRHDLADHSIWSRLMISWPEPCT